MSISGGVCGLFDKASLAQTSPEMTPRVAAYDWAATSLGGVESWSPALRQNVVNLLGNAFGLMLRWGSDFRQIYNDAYRPILGTKHPESLGQPTEQCWPEVWSDVGPLIEQAFAGVATAFDDITLEVRRNGFLEEAHFRVAYSPVFDDTAENGIGGVLTTAQETTVTVVAERRLRVLRDLSVHTAEGKSAKEIYSRAAAVLAGDPRDAPFALVYEIDSEHDAANLVAATIDDLDGFERYKRLRLSRDSVWPFSQIIENRSVVIEDLAKRMKSCPPGWPFPGHLQTAVALPIRSTTRLPAAMLVVGVSPRLALDRTYLEFFELTGAAITTAIANSEDYELQRRRAEGLAELDRAKVAFFSNVSHEFRTPLTLMLGPLDELSGSVAARAAPLVESAKRNALRLLKLVNTLLEFSRNEAGRADASYAQTDLGALTADLCGAFRSAIEHAGLQLTVDIRLKESVFVDRSMWEKIVLNLLSNALKFTPAGEIRVILRKCCDFAELRVSDTGIGVSKKELPHLFERFRRVRSASQRSHEGSGIGLSLVEQLVRLHGGAVGVKSKPEKGTVVRVRVPLGSGHLDSSRVVGIVDEPHVSAVDQYLADTAGAMGSGDRDVPATAVPDGIGSRPRVLVADDNSDLRAYLSHVLCYDYDVVTVSNGAAALATLRDGSFDVVITDVMMPDMDGFALLAAIRADEHLKTVPVLLLTALAGEESTVEGLGRGADDYLVKPFSADVLLAKVKAHVTAAALRRTALERDLASSSWFEQSGSNPFGAIPFRTLADQLPFILWTHDADGSVSYANDFFYQFTKLPREPESLTAIAWVHTTHPEDLDRALEAVGRAILERSGYEFELRIKPVGAGDTSYRWHFYRAIPQYGDGVFLGWFGTAVDVHETHLRADLERALRNAAAAGERALRELAEMVPVIVWTADSTGARDWYNARWYEFTGLTRSESLGWGWQAAQHPDDLQRVMEEWPRCIATGAPFEMEYRLRRADGTFHTVLSRAVAVRDERGAIARWYASVSDIQDQKNALERSEHIVETLQRVFLPDRLPRTKTFRVDAVYRAAESGAFVGGDWFDALQLPDGRHFLSAGDVTGHGVEAAVISARLRHAAADFAMVAADPAMLLRRMNQVLCFAYPGVYATALAAFVDPSGKLLSYASAGHPPPLLATTANEPARSLPHGGPPLGFEVNADFATETIDIPRGAVLALYTDGVTEFARDIESAEQHLKAAVADVVGDPSRNQPATGIMDAVLAGAPTRDDAVLLIANFSDAGGDDSRASDDGETRKKWRFHSSDARSAHIARRELARYLRRRAANPSSVFIAEVVLGEVLANTVEHAPGLVEIELDWSADRPIVTVLDTGPGLARFVSELPHDPLSETGRGLFLIHALAQNVSVTTAPRRGTKLRAMLPLAKKTANL